MPSPARTGTLPVIATAPLILSLCALLSSIRVLWLRDVFMDDNCWLRVIRETDGLTGFLAHSFGPMRREGPGTIFYLLLSQYEQPWFYPLWYSLNLLTELGSPLLLYLLVRKLWHNDTLAFYCGLSLIVLHFDHTIGYLSGINYRLGLLLGLLSLLATAYSRHWIALLLGVVAWAGCTETALAIEPARWVILLEKSRPGATVREFIPHSVLAAAFVVYKLLVRPEGMWQSSYQFTWEHLVKNALSLPYFEAVELWHSLSYQTVTPWLLGTLAAFVLMLVLKNVQKRLDVTKCYMPLILGLSILLSSLALLLYADRELGGSMNSSHVAVMQIGTSLLFGAAFYWLAQKRLIVILALIVALGTVANNKYLDLYFQSWQAQEQFWAWFQREHPTVQATDQFYMDVQDGAYFTDLRTYCDFEAGFQERYGVRPQVYTREQAINDMKRGRAIFDAPRFQQETHLGWEDFETRRMQWIRYRAPVQTPPRLPDRTGYGTPRALASPRPVAP